MVRWCDWTVRPKQSTATDVALRYLALRRKCVVACFEQDAGWPNSYSTKRGDYEHCSTNPAAVGVCLPGRPKLEVFLPLAPYMCT